MPAGGPVLVVPRLGQARVITGVISVLATAFNEFLEAVGTLIVIDSVTTPAEINQPRVQCPQGNKNRVCPAF
jgi:hypothetical protein